MAEPPLRAEALPGERANAVFGLIFAGLGAAMIGLLLATHPWAAVVGATDATTGQIPIAYVILRGGTDEEGLGEILREHVSKEIGPIAKPDFLQWAPGLPKTRSGKIMRRILRKIVADDFENLGDISTLTDLTVVDDLIEGRQSRLG